MMALGLEQEGESVDRTPIPAACPEPVLFIIPTYEEALTLPPILDRVEWSVPPPPCSS